MRWFAYRFLLQATMRVRMHDGTFAPTTADDRMVVSVLVCMVMLAIGIAVRSTTRQRKREVVVRGMRVLDSIKGVVYDPEEIHETLFAFSVPISMSVDQSTVDLTELNDAIQSIGGSLIGMANSAQPNKRNLAIRVNKTAPVGTILHFFSSCIIVFSLLGVGCISWHIVNGQTST